MIVISDDFADGFLVKGRFEILFVRLENLQGVEFFISKAEREPYSGEMTPAELF